MKLLFVSLGCDKNLVDSEVMLGLIRDRGWEITDDETEAEAVVVNTCCFIHDAKEESINTLIEMGELKKTGKAKVLVAAGCLAQRYHDEIKEELPEVDAIIGTTAYEHIIEAVETAWNGKTYEQLTDLNYLPKNETLRMTTTGGHYAYLKIAEGCDKHCTYCIIPKIRGDFRSVPMEKLLEEASYLAMNGVKELILVAQETTLYGKDIYGEKKLPELLRELCKISGLEWIRLLYCYPEEITDELIQVIKEEEKICNYLDMPIQHCADPILKRMGRRTSKDELVEIVTKLRREIPDICLRTTLITGFPGETEEDHQELMDFVDSMEFDRLGVFTYSPEENTAAAKMENQIDEETKTRRQEELMALQQEIAFEKAEDTEGTKLYAMVEGFLPDENIYIGRTYKDAPKVDGYIFVNADRELLSGEIVPVYVTEAKDYDLIGELIQ